MVCLFVASISLVERKGSRSSLPRHLGCLQSRHQAQSLGRRCMGTSRPTEGDPQGRHRSRHVFCLQHLFYDKQDRADQAGESKRTSSRVHQGCREDPARGRHADSSRHRTRVGKCHRQHQWSPKALLAVLLALKPKCFARLFAVCGWRDLKFCSSSSVVSLCYTVRLGCFKAGAYFLPERAQ